MKSYFVIYCGLIEGYDIEKSNAKPNGSDVFKLWREAKEKAVENAKNDVKLVKLALASTRALKKRDA